MTAWRVSVVAGVRDGRRRTGRGGPSSASAAISMSPAGTSGRAGSIDDRTTPTAMTAEQGARPTAPSVSPSATAMTAAMAPSVATIGATIETLPTVSAR